MGTLRGIDAVLVGLLLIFFDFTVGKFDVAPDPLGWALMALGMGQARTRNPALPSLHLLQIASWALAAITAVLTLTELLGIPLTLGPATAVLLIAGPGGFAVQTALAHQLLRHASPHTMMAEFSSDREQTTLTLLRCTRGAGIALLVLSSLILLLLLTGSSSGALHALIAVGSLVFSLLLIISIHRMRSDGNLS